MKITINLTKEETKELKRFTKVIGSTPKKYVYNLVKGEIRQSIQAEREEQ